MESAIPSSRSNRKRPYLEQDLEFDDDSSSKPPKQKKVRFPKGKKVKPGDEAPIAITKVLEEEDGQNPRLAAKERAKRRNLITAELFSEELNDVSTAEVTYQDNESFVEDGIQIEPFNLEKEREEGYFDEAGNFVEYVNENEVKDAWLDSVAVDPRYAGKSSKVTTNEDDTKDDVIELSSEDLGMIKKRISSLLEPGETVLQALRRLKGGSNKRKEKMSPQTQLLFDQLTEDANKLLDHGEYNVYHDKQEVFKREADGYEKLALARGKGTSLGTSMGKDLFSDVTDLGATSSKLSNSVLGASNTNLSTAETTSNGADEYDMFADDDDNAIARPSSDGSNLVSDSNSSGVGQPLTGGPTSNSETGALQDDYVYDETSGYYYSGSSGYYYDPSTGLYCYATSGQWYSYNQETGAYDEIHDISNAN
ncbi:SUPPRESSOR OF ABI3-5 [Ricinus communis]|uniref:SUPPRESSOR OF ABI3-5 n=1 Tax=Ricinus communis TaxID=3988 RepID=UPI00201AC273|nr:SUPPRESSOR OF ABI3-5 [Ricinus communis]